MMDEKRFYMGLQEGYITKNNIDKSIQVLLQFDIVTHAQVLRIKEKAEKYWRATEKYFDSEILKPQRTKKK